MQIAARQPNDRLMTPEQFQVVHVVGGGLAGSEAAWQLARAGCRLFYMKCGHYALHLYMKLAAMQNWCARKNFRSDDREHNAVGCCTRKCADHSLIMRAADKNQVPAGGALAVTDGFSTAVSAELAAHPLITLERGEVALPPDDWDSVIVATGPLTSPDLAVAIARLAGEQQLAFFDAIAPIVQRDSIDLTKSWFQSRYDKAGPGGSGADYINCRCRANSMKLSSPLY